MEFGELIQLPLPGNGEGRGSFFYRSLLMTDVDWNLLKVDILRQVYPPKAVYRKIGWRHGRKVYTRVGSLVGTHFYSIRRVPSIQVIMRFSNPHTLRSKSRFDRFFRIMRRSEHWSFRNLPLWRRFLGI